MGMNTISPLSQAEQRQRDEQLLFAAKAGSNNAVRHALEHYADIHADNDKALRWAAEGGHTETVSLLLDHGADIHANNDEALLYAAECGHTETVSLLLEPTEKNVKAVLGHYQKHLIIKQPRLKKTRKEGSFHQPAKLEESYSWAGTINAQRNPTEALSQWQKLVDDASEKYGTGRWQAVGATL